MTSPDDARTRRRRRRGSAQIVHVREVEAEGSDAVCEHYRCDRTDVGLETRGRPLDQLVTRLVCPVHRIGA